MVEIRRKQYLSINAALFIIAIYTLVLHLLFWHFPLDLLNALSTPEQDDRYSDPNFYLYKAAEICIKSSWSIEDLMVTWSSAGVVGYLTIGCQVFGTEFFYIVLNPLIIILGLGICLYVARNCGLQPNIGLFSIFAIPYTMLTSSLPGKEVISFLGVMLVASGLLIITSKKTWLKGFGLILPGLVFVALNRLHEAVAISIFSILWLTSTSSILLRIALPIGGMLLVATFAPVILSGLQLSATAVSLTDESLWSASSEGKSVNVDAIFDLLRSDNVIFHSLLGFPRVVFVLAAPLSSLFTPWADVEFAYFIFRDLSQRLRLFDLMFIVFAFISVLKIPASRLTSVALETRWLLPSFFLFMIYVIVFFGVSQKSRYVFQYVPLLLIWYWCWRPAYPLLLLRSQAKIRQLIRTKT